jgi:hypothetical protein
METAENKLRAEKQRCESDHTLITKMETADPSPIAKWWDAASNDVLCDYDMHVTTLAGHVTTWSRCAHTHYSICPSPKKATSSSPCKENDEKKAKQ